MRQDMSQVSAMRIVLVVADGGSLGELRLMGASEEAILQAVPGITILAGQHVDPVAIATDCYGDEEGYARLDQRYSWIRAQQRRYHATWAGPVPSWLPW